MKTVITIEIDRAPSLPVTDDNPAAGAGDMLFTVQLAQDDSEPQQLLWIRGRYGSDARHEVKSYVGDLVDEAAHRL